MEETIELFLRWTILALAAGNLLWVAPLAMRALRGPLELWPNAHLAIPLTGILIATVLFQGGWLVDANAPQLVALTLYAASLVIFYAMHFIRLLEIERREGETLGSLRLWRRLCRKR